MTKEDSRWRQRFENFERAFLQWREALDSPRFAEYSNLEKQGVIQQFELTWEMAWKTMKDFLESEGREVVPATPKTTIAIAANVKLITNPTLWHEMREWRNLFSHDYDPARFTEAMKTFQHRYRTPMETLYAFLREQ